MIGSPVNEIYNKCHSLAISGECSSGKSSICKRLSQNLGWVHVNIGMEFRKLTSNEGLDIEQFGKIPNNLLRRVDRKILARMRSEINRIWDGRLASTGLYFIRMTTSQFSAVRKVVLVK